LARVLRSVRPSSKHCTSNLSESEYDYALSHAAIVPEVPPRLPRADACAIGWPMALVDF